MALLPILKFPDPRLRKKASPVQSVDESTRRLAADMAETMYAAPGIGLAATQVDVHKQVIVIDVSEDKTGLITLINPRIVERDGEQVYEEGCLSVPGIYEKVTRSEHIRVITLSLDGAEHEIEAHGHATFHLDLLPAKDLPTLTTALAKGRGARSMPNHLKEQAGLTGVKAALLVALPQTQDRYRQSYLPLR